MNKSNAFLVLCVILTSQLAAAQQSLNKALTIGDRVPNIKFQHVLNYKMNTAKLSDFEGKLVILDLWSTWCTACIVAFPKMEKLQKQFGNKIQILLVNPYKSLDPEKRIVSLLEKYKQRTGFYPSLPIPIHDTIINVLFPHQSIPHEIWINASGKIIAITGEREVTTENIQAALDNKTLNLPVKSDWAFDHRKPLLVDGNGGSSNEFIHRSIFTEYNRNVGSVSGMRQNENKEIIGIYMINQPLRLFVDQAYSDLLNGVDLSRIIIDSKNPERLRHGIDSKNCYCYDLMIPATPFKRIDQAKYLREDLKRCFNLTVYKEKKKMKCLVFTVADKSTISFSKSNKPELDLESNVIRKYIHGFSIADVLKYLDRFNVPLIDETGMNEKIDINFPDNFDFTNQQAVMGFLKKVGFEIKEEERELEVVVITDK